MSSHAPHGQPPLRTVHVLSGRGARVGAHVRSLVAGLVARGVRVTVCAPAETERAFGYTTIGAWHVPMPRSGGPLSVATLRVACTGADLVHAHGLNAALRSVLALTGRRTPLVVTWYAHVGVPGPRAHLVRLLERRVARAASVLLGTSSTLVDLARARGARDARLAALAPTAARRPQAAQSATDGAGHKVRAELGAVDRPLLVTAGALLPGGGHGVLLDAARAWRALDPAPLLAIAGEGPLRVPLQRRIDTEGLSVRLLGRREDVRELLAAADLAVLTGRTGSCAVWAHEALHARVPLVAPDARGIPDVVGDAAELFPPGDADALAAAVTGLLADPARRNRLQERGAARAAQWPTEDQTVAQVLSVYDELTRPLPPARSPG